MNISNKLTAKDGTVVDGAAGNGVTAAITALSTVAAVTDLFSLSGGNATKVAAGDAGIKTGVLSGGTDTAATTRTQSSADGVVVNATNGLTFDIDAIAGGSFDGARGAATDFTYTIDRTESIGDITTAITNPLTTAGTDTPVAGAARAGFKLSAKGFSTGPVDVTVSTSNTNLAKIKNNGSALNQLGIATTK